MTFIKNAWYVAAHAHKLDDGLVARKICDQPIVMYRTDSGAVAALQDRCPHRFVPLSMGKRIGDSVQCGYNGVQFDATGACSHAPNEDDAQRARICVRTYPVIERHALIWLWFGTRELTDPALIPEFEFVGDTKLEHYAVARGCSYIKANYEFLVDNLLDLSHVHYLHPAIHAGSDFASFTNKVRIEGETVWSMLWRQGEYRADSGDGEEHARDLRNAGRPDV